MLTVPNRSGPGRARLLRKHLAEAEISKDGIFSAPDCWILISNPPSSPLARPTLSLPCLPDWSGPTLTLPEARAHVTAPLKPPQAPVLSLRPEPIDLIFRTFYSLLTWKLLLATRPCCEAGGCPYLTPISLIDVLN